jgi:hypothetical protein
MTFADHFDGPDLDTSVWVPHYLPMWSSRAASAATYAVTGSELRLTIPPEQGLWCPDDHEEPLRVSGVQSGVYSGPAGGTAGQQPFRAGQMVREHQPEQWGWTPEYGVLEVRARVELSPALDGLGVDGGSRAGPGRVRRDLHLRGVRRRARGRERRRRHGRPSVPRPGPHRRVRRAAPVPGRRAPHVYAADWQPGRVDFHVDGVHVKTVAQAPAYPMQMMVAVFDFPAKAHLAPDGHVPVLAVDVIRGRPRS